VIHQFSKIGRLAMIGGNTRVNKDAPPFFLYSGFDIEPQAVNSVGLRRAGLTAQQILDLKRAYRILFRTRIKLDEALCQIEKDVPGELGAELIAFVRDSKRGICRRGIVTQTEAAND